jgi:hypothetical protein
MRSQQCSLPCIFAIVLLGCGCTSLQPAANDPEAAGLAAARLRRFHDMAEFDAYRDRVRTLGKSRNVLWSWGQPQPNRRVLLAQNEAEPCDPALGDCGGLQEAIVTGSRKAARQSSITNNQEVDVDEGDIVKQYGRFLIVLQDGRLFSIDTAAHGASLRVVDRIDVYASPDADTWYDELLIHRNNLIITGYSYGEDASEINLISISEAGELEFRARYYIESDDYYSGNNYASRLAHGQFVVYTPLDISGSGPLAIPRTRSWTPAAGLSEWQPLFDITDVYRPIQQTLTPVLHVVSVCRVAQPGEFQCRSRGVVGSAYSEMYVAPDNVYLWLSSDFNDWGFGRRWPQDCSEDVDLYSLPALPAAVFQIPIAGGGVRAVHTIGVPYDQFAFDERQDRLLALLKREPAGCYLSRDVPMVFSSIALRLFSSSPTALRSDASVPLAATRGWGLQNRYSDHYLLYGMQQGYWRSEDEPREPGQLVVVPIASPSSFEVLRPPHTVERIELIGDNAVAFGLAAPVDLGISTIELRTQPRVAGTEILGDLRESEGRSHAFNALIADDGSGLFGLPTVYRSKADERWETPADVQFFATDAALAVMPVGELAGTSDEDETYTCQVSCYDWYGNARPIFLDGRVFALSGSELIEGEARSGVIVETARLRITAEQDPRPGFDAAHRLAMPLSKRARPIEPPNPVVQQPLPEWIDFYPTR